MSTKQNEEKGMLPSSLNEGELRRRAEEKAFAMGTRDLESLSPEDSARLLKELQLHQIELEMQNEELEASRAHYFDLYDLAPAGYVTLSENSLILEANLTAATLLGLPKMVLIKTSLSRYILPDDQDTFYMHCRQLFKTGEPQVFEIRVIRADGGRLWVKMEAHAGQDGGNGVLICRAVMNDITERKGAEEQLRYNEEDLNRAQSVAQTGSWRLNIRRNELRWSDESYRIFGIAKGMPMTYEKFLAAIHPADKEFVDLKWKAALRGEPYDVEHRILVGGKLKWVHEKAELEFDDFGKLLGGFGSVQDITARKQADEALRESKERFHRLFEDDLTGDFFCTPEGQILECNPAFAAIFGFSSRDEAVGANLLDLYIDPGDRVPMLQALKKKGKLGPYEAWRKRRDGELIHIMENVVGHFNDKGELYEINGYIFDDTERKRAEEAVKEARRSQERKSNLLQSIMDSAWNSHLVYLDRDFNFVHVNEVYARSCGYAPDVMIGKNHFALYPHEENEAIFTGVRDSGISFKIQDKAFVFPDQPERGVTYWDWALAPVKDPSGMIEGLVLSLFETTERKRAEEALLESKELFEKTFISQLDAIFLLDASIPPIIINCNPAAVKMFGYNREEMLGCTTNALHVNEGALNRFQKKLYPDVEERGFLHLSDFEMKRKDGEIFPTEHSVIPLQDDEGRRTGWVSVIRDSTERKEMEEKIRKANDELELRVQERTKELEQRNQDVENFTFVTAHHLHEPLRKIQTFADLLSTEYAEVIHEKGRDYLQRMQGAATRMRDLLQALLEYSRMTAKAEPFTRVRLNEIAHEVVSDLDAQIKESGAMVEIGELPEVDADRCQMFHLLHKLVENGVKFRREGKIPWVKIHADSSGESKPGVYEFHVEDNGIGFSEEYQDRIFVPFQRLHGGTEYDGVGMGLAICKRVMERHKGSIRVKSTPGKGSTFIVTLPVDGTEAAREPE